MKTLKLSALIVFSVLFQTVSAQKSELSEASEVLAAAQQELGQSLQEGEFFEWSRENGIEGTYTFELTLERRGNVASVAVVNREGGSIAHQNQLKDFIRDYRFGFKMPKGKYYQFRYTFSF